MSDTALSGLNAKQRAFVQEMLADDNPHKAAMRAGYPVNELESHDETVYELMSNERVLEALRAARAQQESRVATNQASVLHEMSLLAQSSLEHYVIDDDGNVQLAEGAPAGAMRAVQSVKRKVSTRTDKEGGVTRTVDVEIKLWDKPTPLRLMGRQVGLFAERVEHTGKDGKPIEIEAIKVTRIVVDARVGSLDQPVIPPDVETAH
jgi:phage terminase small subunit